MSCGTESVIPAWVSVGFGVASVIMLIITIIYSMKSLKRSASPNSSRNNENMTAITISTETKPLENKDIDVTSVEDESEWNKASGGFAKFKLCARDVWRRKSVYLPLISHLSDTATDFASVVEFGMVAANSDPNQCNVNVWYLFSLAIICMTLYRVISGYKVYDITGSRHRACLQLLDLELYRILYISHVFGLNSTSSPQRLLSVLEAVFEAAPQSVIQMIFLMFTGNKSGVIIASAIFSFFNLTISVIGDDKTMLRIAAVKPSCKETTEKDPKYGDMDITWKRYKFAEFALLYLYRFMDIPSKILSYVFLWYFIHGALCFLFILIDVGIAFAMYYKTKNTDALLSVIAVPFTLGNKEHAKLLKMYLYGSVIETIVLNILIWSFAGRDREPGFIILLWVYCSICMVGKWIILRIFARVYIPSWTVMGDEGFVEVFSENSKERSDVNTLVSNTLWSEALEIIIYKYPLSLACTKVYGRERSKENPSAQQKTLLDLAVECKNKAIVEAVRREFDDRKITSQGLFETELIRQIKKGDTKNVELILNAPETHWDYIWRRDYEFQDAFYYAYDKNLDSLIWNKILQLLRNDSDRSLNTNIYFRPPFGSSLLAMCLIRDQPECFQIILDHYGVDFIDEEVREAEYTFALYEAIDKNKLECIRKILNAPGIHAKYITMRTSGSFDREQNYNPGGTPLSSAMHKYKVYDEGAEIIKLIFECVNRVCDETETVDVLNDVYIRYKWTALHKACEERSERSLELFQMMYTFYPVAFRRDALLKKDNGKYWDDKKERTVLDICNDFPEDENVDIKTFIEQQMAQLNSVS